MHNDWVEDAEKVERMIGDMKADKDAEFATEQNSVPNRKINPSSGSLFDLLAVVTPANHPKTVAKDALKLAQTIR